MSLEQVFAGTTTLVSAVAFLLGLAHERAHVRRREWEGLDLAERARRIEAGERPPK